MPDLADDEQPGKGFEVNPGKVAYGGQIDNYTEALNKWPEPLARKSTAESVSGQFFETWAKNPEGSFPVAVAPEEVLSQAGIASKSVSVAGEQVAETLAAGGALADYAAVQAVLDTGLWKPTAGGWIVTAGQSVVEIRQAAVGAPMVISKISL
jgi:hypothetical protein